MIKIPNIGILIFMNNSLLKSTVVLWAKHVGRERALGRLILTEQIGISTAQKIVDGKYDFNPRPKIRALLESELAKDGFTVSDDKAS